MLASAGKWTLWEAFRNLAAREEIFCSFDVCSAVGQGAQNDECIETVFKCSVPTDREQHCICGTEAAV
jgi:hypothetical protein